MDLLFNVWNVCNNNILMIENTEIYHAMEKYCTVPLHDHENRNFYFISHDRK